MSQATEVARVKTLSPGGKIEQFKQFGRDVKTEMKKVSWPTRQEVYSTTLVVLIAVFFFGFFLWGVDVLITLGLEALANLFK
ncbi:MAG: preprotein translocase subunit SecE [Acidobacteriota bacterium]